MVPESINGTESAVKTKALLLSLAAIIVIFVPILVTLMMQPTSAQPGRLFFGSQQPQIAVSENNVNIAWSYYNPDNHLYLITSNDSGTSFGEKIRLNRNSTLDMGLGNLVINNNDIYYAGTDLSLPQTTRFFFIKSTDYGFTFSKPVVISSHDTYSTEVMELHRLLVLGNNVYVIWSTSRHIFVYPRDIGTIFLSESTDGGLSFHKPIEINEHDTSLSGPEIATAGNKIYFIWGSVVSQECAQDNCKTLVHIRSLENNTLSQIYTPITLDNLSQLKISASENSIYLTGVAFQTDSLDHVVMGVRTPYTNGTAPQWVFFSKSVDGGATFDKPVNLSGSRHHCTNNGPNGRCEIGDIYSYASGTDVYVIWEAENYTKNAQEAFFAGSTNNGNTFGKVIQLNPYGFDDIVCEFVVTCVDIKAPASKDTVYLVWSANNMHSEQDHVIFAKSIDGGNTFDYTDISDKTGITDQPVLSLGRGTIYVAGTNPGFQEGNHVFFAKSIDGGNTFSNGTDLDLQQEASVPEFPVSSFLVICIAMGIMLYIVRIGRHGGLRFANDFK